MVASLTRRLEPLDVLLMPLDVLLIKPLLKRLRLVDKARIAFLSVYIEHVLLAPLPCTAAMYRFHEVLC